MNFYIIYIAKLMLSLTIPIISFYIENSRSYGNLKLILWKNCFQKYSYIICSYISQKDNFLIYKDNLRSMVFFIKVYIINFYEKNHISISFWFFENTKSSVQIIHKIMIFPVSKNNNNKNVVNRYTYFVL